MRMGKLLAHFVGNGLSKSFEVIECCKMFGEFFVVFARKRKAEFKHASSMGPAGQGWNNSLDDLND